MRTRIVRPAALLLALTLVHAAGCGSDEPSRSDRSSEFVPIALGAERSDVEVLLGTSISSIDLQDGRKIDVYEFNSDMNPTPAFEAGPDDAFTRALWRGAYMKPTARLPGRERVAIAYDESDSVIAMNPGRFAQSNERADAGEE